jgi:hypothetical protein
MRLIRSPREWLKWIFSIFIHTCLCMQVLNPSLSTCFFNSHEMKTVSERNESCWGQTEKNNKINTHFDSERCLKEGSRLRFECESCVNRYLFFNEMYRISAWNMSNKNDERNSFVWTFPRISSHRFHFCAWKFQLNLINFPYLDENQWRHLGEETFYIANQWLVCANVLRQTTVRLSHSTMKIVAAFWY